MAPRHDNDDFARRSHRQSSNRKAPPKNEREKQSNSTRIEDNGDVLMAGYRIPTTISSKGAIQHKLDRYAPHKSQVDARKNRHISDNYKGHGHKRYGGRYDEPRHNHESRHEPTSAEEYQQRYGNERKQHRDSHIEDKHHYQNYEKSSRRDRYAREYHHAVTSSRSRYEQDSAGYHGHHASTWAARHGRRYESNEHHSNSRYSHERRSYNPNRNSTAERSYTSRRDGGGRGDTSRTGYAPNYSQKQAHNRGSYGQPDHLLDPDLGEGFEGAMKTLAAHAEKFLKNAHWRDREEIETAVWKAYGDSIASLGYRKTRGASGCRPNGWVSANGIANRDDGPFIGVPRGPKAMYEHEGRGASSRSFSTTHRSKVLEKYQKANSDYEKTLDDLFGGKPSYAGSHVGSGTSPSYARPNSCSRQKFQHSEPSYTGLPTNSVPSIHPNSIMNSSRVREDIPRPKPPLYHNPIYMPDPKDPMRYLNVPRPLMREQWHIPADYYNGEAWEENRKREIESGALSSIYPDRWFSGDSYTKDTKSPKKHIRSDSIIGRDCYTEDIDLSISDDHSRSCSIASELGHNFGSIRLNSIPPSTPESARACSEFPEDFDLYGQSPIQPNTCLGDGQIDQDDDGSRTPRQHILSSEVPISLISNENSFREDSDIDNDHYQSSREATPTLCLADMIEYAPSATTISLKNTLNKASLMDIALSIPSSPNESRSGAATPPYYSRANYNPLLSQKKIYEPLPYTRDTHNNSISSEDWDSSFYSAPGLKRNPTFTTKDQNIAKHNGSIKGGVLVNQTNPAIRSYAKNDDDLDFLGVEFFAKSI